MVAVCMAVTAVVVAMVVMVAPAVVAVRVALLCRQPVSRLHKQKKSETNSLERDQGSTIIVFYLGGVQHETRSHHGPGSRTRRAWWWPACTNKEGNR
jgi:hypothetical protein